MVRPEGSNPSLGKTEAPDQRLGRRRYCSARSAALAALRQLDDRELKDIGIYRGQIDDVIERAARSRLHRLGKA